MRTRPRPPTASRGAARTARALNSLTLDPYTTYDTIAAHPAASRRVHRPAVRTISTPSDATHGLSALVYRRSPPGYVPART